jgi:hypothetical protein
MRSLLPLVVLVCCPLAARADAGSGSAGSASASPEDFVPDAWFTAHGATAPSKELQQPCCCIEITVGSPGELGLRCLDAEGVNDHESAQIGVRTVIQVVRAKKVVKVLDAWTGFLNMDSPAHTPPMIDSDVTFDKTGRTATVTESGKGRLKCDHLDKPSPQDGDFERIRRQWIDRVCASRGTYHWRGGRYQR